MFGALGSLGSWVHQIRIQISAVDMVGGAVRSSIAKLERLRYAAIAITDASRRLMLVGAALTAAFAFPVKEAVAFDYGIRQIQKAADLSFSEVQSGIDGLIEKRIPQTIEGFMNIAKIVSRSGIEGKEAIFSLTEAIAKLDVATDLDADKSAETLIRFSKAFNIPIQDAERMGSALTQLAYDTTTEVPQIVSALQRLGKPTVGNVRFEELAGLVAALPDLTVPSFITGTEFRNIFLNMVKNADEMAGAMKMSTQDWVKYVEQDAIGALLSIVGVINTMDKKTQTDFIIKFFGRRAMLVIGQMMGNLERVKDVIASGKKGYEENTALARSMALEQLSPMGKLIVFWQSFRRLLGSIGDAVLPWLIPFVDRMTDAVQAMARFAREHRGLMKMVMGLILLAGVGSVITSVFLKVFASILSFTVAVLMARWILLPFAEALSATGIGGTIASGGILKFLASVLAAAAPVAAIIVSLALLALVFKRVYDNSTALQRAVQSLVSTFQISFGPVLYDMGYLMGVMTAAAYLVAEQFSITDSKSRKLGEGLSGLIGPGSVVQFLLLAIGSVLETFVNPALSIMAFLVQSIAGGLRVVIAGLKQLGGGAWNLLTLDFEGAAQSWNSFGPTAMQESEAFQRSFEQLVTRLKGWATNEPGRGFPTATPNLSYGQMFSGDFVPPMPGDFVAAYEKMYGVPPGTFATTGVYGDAETIPGMAFTRKDLGLPPLPDTALGGGDGTADGKGGKGGEPNVTKNWDINFAPGAINISGVDPAEMNDTVKAAIEDALMGVIEGEGAAAYEQ